MIDAGPASSRVPRDGPDRMPGQSSFHNRGDKERSRRPRFAAVAGLAVAASATIGLAWVRTSAEWRVSIVLGAALLLAAAAIGLPFVFRARNDLQSARRLLLVATRRMEEAYERLLVTNEELRRTADDRDRALADLRAAVRARESFLDAIAHDLRTPLTIIKGNTDLLAGALARGTPPEPSAMSRNLGRIAENADRMRLMINELLALARLEGDEPIIADRKPTDLVELARAAIASAAVETGRHRIVLDAQTEGLIGEWDRQRLERLLANLLANAIKYSPAGGTVTVAVDTEADGSIARLSVRDEGIGIPADELGRVFERLYRARNVPVTVPGTGLGLASVRQTAELHGGVVEVQSDEGAGSIFTVRLPTRPPSSDTNLG
jgi:signal transduction histidine kinase